MAGETIVSIFLINVQIGKPVMVGFGSFDGDDGAAKLDLSLLANSVLEGVDGIFLATGSLSVKDTVNLVRDAHAVCREAEQARWQRQIFEELTYKVEFFFLLVIELCTFCFAMHITRE